MPAIAYTPRWLPSMMMVMMKRPKGVTYIELLFCFFFIFLQVTFIFRDFIIFFRSALVLIWLAVVRLSIVCPCAFNF